MKEECELPGGRTKEEARVIVPPQQTCWQLLLLKCRWGTESEAESWQVGEAGVAEIGQTGEDTFLVESRVRGWKQDPSSPSRVPHLPVVPAAHPPAAAVGEYTGHMGTARGRH